MLDWMEARRVSLGDAELYLRLGGDGPPLLLLHGYPQTHLAWHRVAPLLARDFTLVIPDLRPPQNRSSASAVSRSVSQQSRSMVSRHDPLVLITI